MATVTDLKVLLDLYGVGVRAGTITPQMEDEAYFRKIADMPEMSEAVKKAWEEDGGFRRPITLATGAIQVASGDPNGGLNEDAS